MKRRIAAVVLLVLSVVLWLPRTAVAAAPCSLCIVEVQTQGLGGASEEYIVIANNTQAPYDLTGHTLRYRTASGTSGGTIVLSGSLAASATRSFVSANAATLKDANPSSTTFTFGIADAGGTLEISKTGQTALVDQVGWGTASLHEGSVATTHDRGWSLVRSQTNGVYQDTGDNAADFAAAAHACFGLSLNEIQPQLVDGDGYDLDVALETLSTSGAVTDQDCPINLNGSVQLLAASELGAPAGLAVVYHALDTLGNETAFNLHPDAANNLQFVPRSSYGGVTIPGSLLTQPLLATGQTYAHFSSGWKATYQPTLGTANQLRTTPLVPALPDPTPVADDCGDIYVNELLPNPDGEDTGNEWAEFINATDHSLSFAGCMLVVNGTQYSFAADQFIAAGDLVVLGNFSDGTTLKSLSLRNSDTNTVSFGRFDSATSTFVPLQTVQYADAPEGQAWARFDDGWRWVEPTPAEANLITVPDGAAETPTPTEFPAAQGSSDEGGTPAGGGEVPSGSNQPSAVLAITELLPNPAPPATDDTDEYVELYNPGVQTVNLSGYKLQTGNSYNYSYTLAAGTIGPHEYRAFYSHDTNLVLANTSGRARLLAPNGQTVSETDPYDNADDGQAWALIAGTWQWTNAPSPNAANLASIPVLATAKTAKASSKSASAKKSAAPKTATAGAKTTKSSAATERQVYQDPAELPPPIHTGILAGVGGFALVYAGYEYRYDAVNTLHRFRRYRELRRANRAKPTGP